MKHNFSYLRIASIKIILLALLLASCATVDLDAAVPVYDTGVDPGAWVTIPAGEFIIWAAQ